MKKGTAIILAGIVILFLISLYVGKKIFPAEERALSLTNLNPALSSSPEAAKAAREWAEFRKVRLALSSFDLANGLTLKEMEDISSKSRAFAYYFLLASLWLALGLRKPRRCQSPTDRNFVVRRFFT